VTVIGDSPAASLPFGVGAARRRRGKGPLRQFAIFSALLLVGLMAVFDVLVAESRHNAEMTATQLVRGMAEALAAHLNERIGVIDAVLTQADVSVPASGVTAGPDAALAALVVGRPELRAVLVTDAMGVVSHSSDIAWLGVDLGGSPWFAPLLRGAQADVLGKPSRDGGHWLLPLGRPRAGAGAVVAVLDSQALLAAMGPAAKALSVDLALFDRDGMRLADTDPANPPGQRQRGLWVFAHAPVGGAGFTWHGPEDTTTGRAVIGAVVGGSAAPILAVVTQPHATVTDRGPFPALLASGFAGAAALSMVLMAVLLRETRLARLEAEAAHDREVSREILMTMNGVTGMAGLREDPRPRVACAPPLEPSPPPQTWPAEPGGVLAGMRVLLAEDNLTNQLVIRAMLTRGGAEVTVVSDGAAAVPEAVSGAYDVVLMDVQMPGMDGLSATRAIRAAAHGGRHQYVIGLTATIGPEQELECHRAGMDSCLSKPVSRNVLLEALAQVVTRHPPSPTN
jgi:CheY-like chemotaxis protein